MAFYFLPFLMLFYREIRRFGKVVVQTILTPLVTASLYLLIFGVSLGQSISLEMKEPYLAFIIPGLVMMGILNNAFQNSSTSIVAGKFSGDIQDLKVVPLNFHQIVWALSLAGLTRGLLVGGITYLVGLVFCQILISEVLLMAHPLWFLVFSVIGGLTFSMLGISVAFWANSFDQLSAVTSFILTPLIYLGGVFFSLEILHPTWQSVSKFNPLLYLVNGVRFGILGHSDVEIGLALGVSIVTLVACYMLAMRSLSRASFTRW